MKQQKTKLVKLYSEVVRIPILIDPIRVGDKRARRCTIIADKLYSYDTQVAVIDWTAKAIFVRERAYRYSPTTTRQISRVTREFELTMVAEQHGRIRKADYTHSRPL